MHVSYHWMDKTRISLFYVAGYLLWAGVGMTLFPRLLLDMMFATGSYELVFVRMCGLFVLGLAAFVVQTIRLRLRALYPTIIGVRVVFCAGYVVLYAQTRDPFFLSVLAIVGAGLVASSICYRLDRRPTRTHRPPAADLTIDANGVRFAALAWGRPSDPLVLLFHGFPDSAYTWREIGPAIAAAGYRVVAPFLRGYPPSGMPARDTDSRTLGEDVVAIADALGAGKVRIVGHDWGAEAVYAAVALAPERFERMVAIAIPHRAGIRLTPTLLWRARHFLTLVLPRAAARFAAGDYAMVDVLCTRWSPTWKHSAADLEEAKNVLAAPGALDAALGYYRAARFRTPEFLRAPVTVRTLNIAGADDPAAPPPLFEGTRALYRAGYELAVVRGGHFCHRESPAACVAAIVPFLA
jgi:pimeloyl-ACP methyl ester carboxylesterase